MKKTKEKFKRSSKYNNGFDVFFEQQYKIATENNDMKSKKELNEMLYKHLHLFVESDLSKRVPTIISNASHKEDLIQQTWLTIYENAQNYKAGKSCMTTYFTMWIKHSVDDFYCKNILHTTSYYAKNIRAIDKAYNECILNNIFPDLNQLSQMTNLSERKIKNACLQKAHSEKVYFSEEWEKSILHTICGKRSHADINW